MKKLLFILLLVASECNAEEDPFLADGWRHVEEVWAEELLVGAEYGHSPRACIRWDKSPTLTVCEPSESQKQIVVNAVKEINQALSRTKVQIKLCEDNDPHANIVVSFVDKEVFKKKALHHLDHWSDGLNGFVNVGKNGNIIKTAVVFLNIDLLKDDDELVHVTLEEITQSLGILNDSWHYEDSIFYQGRSFTKSLSFLDKQLICFFYFYIDPGDTKETVLKKYKEHFRSIKADWIGEK